MEWENSEGVDFWERKPGQPIRIMVAPATQDKFIDFLNVNNIENEVAIENVEMLV